MDRWKAVTSGYRLAFESPETWYVATLNNAQAYFSIAYISRCRCRGCKHAIVTVPIYFQPFIVNNIPRILQKLSRKHDLFFEPKISKIFNWIQNIAMLRYILVQVFDNFFFFF